MNAPVAVASASGFAEADLLSSVMAVMVSARSELLLFVAAIVAYLILFSQRSPTNGKARGKKIKVMEEECKEEDYPVESYTKSSPVDPQECANVEKVLGESFENGDYRQ